MQETAAFRHGDAGDRIGHRLGAQGRSLKWIERDIDAPALTASELFADVEHRCLITLAFADDHEPIHLDDRIERLAHGIDRRPVRELLIAPAPPASCSDGRRFGDAGNLDGEHSVEHQVLRKSHTFDADRAGFRGDMAVAFDPRQRLTHG